MQKLKLQNIDTGDVVTCLYNPSEYTIAKAADYNTPTQTGKDMGESEFTGGAPRSLSMELFFDVYETKNGDVRNSITPLWKLISVDRSKKAGQTGRSRPPRIQIVWGNNYVQSKADKVTWVMTNLSVRYTLFSENGTPVRAVASVSLQEALDGLNQKRQNPTSYTEAGARTRVVAPQDTLPMIAYQEFGDSNQWRTIAAANGIVDPSAIEAGQVLTIPQV